MFPARGSHNSRSNKLYMKYLDASLTVAEMHRLFNYDHPDLQETWKYWFYHDIFNFNIKF